MGLRDGAVIESQDGDDLGPQLGRDHDFAGAAPIAALGAFVVSQLAVEGALDTFGRPGHDHRAIWLARRADREAVFVREFLDGLHAGRGSSVGHSEFLPGVAWVRRGNAKSIGIRRGRFASRPQHNRGGDDLVVIDRLSNGGVRNWRSIAAGQWDFGFEVHIFILSFSIGPRSEATAVPTVVNHSGSRSSSSKDQTQAHLDPARRIRLRENFAERGGSRSEVRRVEDGAVGAVEELAAIGQSYLLGDAKAFDDREVDLLNAV